MRRAAAILGASIVLAGIGTTATVSAHQRAPHACVQAINDYSQFATYAGQALNIAAQFAGEIAPAAAAGAADDSGAITAITAKLDKWTSQIDNINKEMNTLAPKLHKAVRECEG